MSVSPEDCTLIVSTYNWSEALELTLKSILKQSKIPAEVIIADDGSTEKTKLLIDAYKKTFPTKLIHLWQEDIGFRLATIRNKAFELSSKRYLIQIDGDIILHPNFIEDHLRFAKEGCLLQGSRVMLGKSLSQKLLTKKEIRVSFFDRDIKRRENLVRNINLSEYLLTRYRNRYPIYFARGANMSFWKKDIMEVNGYNEKFEGWGHEDSDLTLRLLNSGKRKLVLKFSAIAYHLYHLENKTKEKDDINKAILEETLRLKNTRTKWGINKLSDHHESI